MYNYVTDKLGTVLTEKASAERTLWTVRGDDLVNVETLTLRVIKAGKPYWFVCEKSLSKQLWPMRGAFKSELDYVEPWAAIICQPGAITLDIFNPTEDQK